MTDTPRIPFNQEALAAFLTHSLEDKTRKGIDVVVEGLRSSYHTVRTDPSHPHIITLGMPKQPDVRIDVKERFSSEIAEYEVDLLNHLWRQNGITPESLGFPFMAAGPIVLSPFVGPEVYDIFYQLNEMIPQTQNDERENLIFFRRALLFTIVDAVARADFNPFQDGHNLNLEEGQLVIEGYTNNIRKYLVDKEVDSYTLEKVLSVFSELFDANSGVIYSGDFYLRNWCYLWPDWHNGKFTLQDMETLLIEIQSTEGGLKQKDFSKYIPFLSKKIGVIDGHRIKGRRALRGETIEHVLGCPRLHDPPSPLTKEEREAALSRYYLKLELLRQRGKNLPGNEENERILFDQIRLTESCEYPLSRLKSQLHFNTDDEIHEAIMECYKAIRLAWYMENKYIPSCQTVISRESTQYDPEVAEYRLELYKKDFKQYKKKARDAVKTIQKFLFDQLPGDNNEKTINLMGTPYYVCYVNQDNVGGYNFLKISKRGRRCPCNFDDQQGIFQIFEQLEQGNDNIGNVKIFYQLFRLNILNKDLKLGMQ